MNNWRMKSATASQAQEELRLWLEQHQIIMDQTTDILFEWDIRIPLSDNIHPEDMPAFVKIMKDTADGKPYSETEFRIKDSKDRYCWCAALGLLTPPFICGKTRGKTA